MGGKGSFDRTASPKGVLLETGVPGAERGYFSMEVLLPCGTFSCHYSLGWTSNKTTVKKVFSKTAVYTSKRESF